MFTYAAALSQAMPAATSQVGRRRNFPFRKQAMLFSWHLEKFLTINQFFSAELEKKGNYVYNHPASNPEPLFPNILLYHYTTRLIRQFSAKFYYKALLS